MRNQKHKLGPQAALDYERAQLPDFVIAKQMGSTFQVKNQKYYSGVPKNLWMDSGKLYVDKSKTYCVGETEKGAVERGPSAEQNIFQQKRDLISQTKHDSKQRTENRLLEIALVQQQCKQEVDDRQIDLLMKNPQNPVKIQNILLKTKGRAYLPGATDSMWNKLSDIGEKSKRILFTQKMKESEKEGIDYIKQRISESQENKLTVKSCFLKEGEDIRRSFQERRNKNLEIERDLKLGVFGQNVFDKEQNKVVRNARTPNSFYQNFPVKYETDPYVKKLKSKSIPENKIQIYARLSSPKKTYEPENIYEYPDFKGLLTPAIDRIMCIKQSSIVDQFKEISPQVNVMMEEIKHVPDTIKQRLKTAQSECLGFKIDPLSSFDNIQIQRSLNYHYNLPTDKEMVQEMEDFSIRLKSNNNSRPSTGFSRVSRKEHELLKSLQGYKIMQKLKQNQFYPQNLIKGFDS